MRWRGRRQSDQVEDRRGASGGGRMRRPASLGGGILVVIIALVIFAMGGDPQALLKMLGNAPAPAPQAPRNPGGRNAAEDELAQFVSVVLADTEDVWTARFKELGENYRKPKLVLFTDQVSSACGSADASVGPFYCPADETIYIDLQFYQDLKKRFGAPGDFAQAYVIAHEVGHHVQKLRRVSDQVNSMRGSMSANELSVRQELQADYFAGVWAHHAHKSKHILESGDIEEAMRCAAAIGDDRIQRKSRGRVNPDSFTHGSSEQRVRWFRKGLESGDMTKGDTFQARDL
ncbi:MAG: putative metalloprotease [Pirellulaceae bacterium]|jgi:predicted metalloprotease